MPPGQPGLQQPGVHGMGNHPAHSEVLLHGSDNREYRYHDRGVHVGCAGDVGEPGGGAVNSTMQSDRDECVAIVLQKRSCSAGMNREDLPVADGYGQGQASGEEQQHSAQAYRPWSGERSEQTSTMLGTRLCNGSN